MRVYPSIQISLLSAQNAILPTLSISFLPYPFLSTLPIDIDETQKHDPSPDPIREARILRIDNYLANKRERDREAQADSHNQGRGKEHRVRPADIREEGSDGIEQNDDPHSIRLRQAPALYTRKMQNDKPRPQQQDIEEPHESKEQRHTDPGLGADALFHHDGVDAVQNGAEERHRVADGEFTARFVWEGAAVVVAGAGEVDAGDEEDAEEREEDAEEFAEREGFDAEEGAEQERPDAACGCEDGGAGYGGVLETCHGEVVGEEPEDAEFEA